MSGLPRIRTLWITPLSPVHMGTDEDYVPTNYVIEDDALFEFDHRALTGLSAADREALTRLLDGRPDAALLKKVQSFIHQHREDLIPEAVNVVRTCSGVAALYRSRVGRAANVERGGREVYNLLEIERAAYNPSDHRLYLPGSGLKGAIRTALLNQENQGRPLPSDLNRDRQANRKLQERLFSYTMRELHKDPLRLVQVSDCYWCGPDTLNSAEILFAVNRKKHPVRKNGEEVLSRAERGGLYQLLECAAPFRFRAFRGTLSVSDVHVVGDHPELPRRRFDFQDIAAACNAFYRPIFERESRQQRERGYLDDAWRRTVTSLLADPTLKARLDSGSAFLLRAGRHSGAESVTLDGVRNIRIMQGRGEAQWASEAKTWWLAAGEQDDRRHLTPFGWLLVEIGDDLPAWEAAQAIVEHALAEQQRWLSAVTAKQERLRTRLQQRRAAEAARRQAEETRRRREEAQARRLAEMSEEERRIEAVRTLLERDRQAGRKEAGGELNQKRLELLQSALNWDDPTLRSQAAELLEETAHWLPWAKKRKKEIREQLARLRQNP